MSLLCAVFTIASSHAASPVETATYCKAVAIKAIADSGAWNAFASLFVA